MIFPRAGQKEIDASNDRYSSTSTKSWGLFLKSTIPLVYKYLVEAEDCTAETNACNGPYNLLHSPHDPDNSRLKTLTISPDEPRNPIACFK